jgi:hypothetical protein
MSAQDIDSRALLRAQKDQERHGTLYYVLLGVINSGRDAALNMAARASQDTLAKGVHEDGQDESRRPSGGG